jgi:hypothetical protein
MKKSQNEIANNPIILIVVGFFVLFGFSIWNWTIPLFFFIGWLWESFGKE